LASIVASALEPWIWIWAGSFCVAAVLWLLGVQYLDLSYAFPLLSCGYVLVTLLSIIVFKERVGALRWLAVGIISAGVALIAGS
jgi:undecaprenyl phosphate-alpha-L-ara4N flippase subunit ArnE